MKRCAQWCCLLWIAITLIIPQTAVVADVHTAGTRECRLTADQPHPLPIIGETSLIGLIKVENQPDKTPERSPSLSGTTRQRPGAVEDASVRAGIDWATDLPSSPVRTLPPGRGPPRLN